MKKQLSELWFRYEQGQLTGEDQQQLDQQPDLRQQFEKLKATGALLGLKGYIRIPDGAERRCLQEVRTRIAEGQREKPAVAWQAGWRWAFVTAFVGMLTLHAFTLHDFTGSSLIENPADSELGAAAFHHLHATNEGLAAAPTIERPVVLVASNQSLHYGNEFNHSKTVSGYLTE